MSSDTLAKSAPPMDPERPRDETLPVVVRRRRHGRWTAAVLVLVLLGLAVNSVVRNRAFFALGTLLAAGRLSSNPVLRSVSWGHVRLFRSIPILVRLLLTVDLLCPVAVVAIIGLTLNRGGEQGVVAMLRSAYLQQLGGSAAGYAVAGRGGMAIGQPAKRQPFLFGALPSGGVTR